MQALTLQEWVFVGEYLKHGRGSVAARVSGYEGHYAADYAYQMLKRPHVADEVRRGQAAMREQQGLTRDLVIDDIVGVLRADPRDLIQFVTGSCRHCHGLNHDYQYTVGELRRVRAAFYADPLNVGKPFSELGGAGFDAYRDPHPACPECNGRGVQMPQLRDTRELSPETASLYAGIRQTKHGLEFILRSKDAAREAAARYLGMNTENVNVNVTKPLSAYTDEELLELMQQGKK